MCIVHVGAYLPNNVCVRACMRAHLCVCVCVCVWGGGGGGGGGGGVLLKFPS